MKRNIYPLLAAVLFVLINLHTYATSPQLSWRMSNPRIVYASSANWLKFDVEVKCDSAGRYLHSMSVVFDFNNSAFPSTGGTSNVLVTRGSQYTGTNTVDDNKYNVSSGVQNTPKTLTVGLAADPVVEGDPATVDDYSQILTGWHTFVSVQFKILNLSLNAGMVFRLVDFATGYYRCEGEVLNRTLQPPHILDTKNMAWLYLERIYNSVNGWTQKGGSLAWGTTCNTSVWDSVASMSATGGLVTKLRIHRASPAPGTNQIATEPGGRFKILAGGQLTCSDSVTIEEPRGLWIISTAAGTGSFIDNNKNLYPTSGSALMERYFTMNKWHFYSMPVTQAWASVYNDTWMKYFVEPGTGSGQNWKYVIAEGYTPDSLLTTAMQGFAIWADQTIPPLGNWTVRPSGVLNTGTLSFTTKRTDGQAYEGYNLTGNPYASAIDLSSGSVTWNNNDQKAWFWDPGIGDYTLWLYAGGGSRTSSIAPAQQGFFVHHAETSTTPTTLQLANGARLHNTEVFLKDEIGDRLVLTSSATNGYGDIAVVRFLSDASAGYDAYYDGEKMGGLEEAPQLYMPLADNTNLTVNALPWSGTNQVVPLSFYCGVTGNYTITASNMESFRNGVQVFLEDKKTVAAWQELTVNPSYQFSWQTGESNDRFNLHFANKYFGVNEHAKNVLQIYSYEKNIYVRSAEKVVSGKIFVYDVSGRQIFQGNLENLPINKFRMDVNEGYYLVTVVSPESIENQKVFLN
ncbi:MAG: hypothetical protein NTX61_09940 [Bacteroidetes bacterium]|nr:hypothetical protein [Bacteroidota bacterium]